MPEKCTITTITPLLTRCRSKSGKRRAQQSPSTDHHAPAACSCMCEHGCSNHLPAAVLLHHFDHNCAYTWLFTYQRSFSKSKIILLVKYFMAKCTTLKHWPQTVALTSCLRPKANHDARSIYSTVAGDAIGGATSCCKYYDSLHVIMITALALACCPMRPVQGESFIQKSTPYFSYPCYAIFTYSYICTFWHLLL